MPPRSRAIVLVSGAVLIAAALVRLRSAVAEPPVPAEQQAPHQRAKPPATKDVLPKDPFERRVSLAADGIPLREALQKIAAEAQLGVDLDTETLEETGLDLDRPVSITFEDLPLAAALGRLIQWQAYPGALRHVRRGKLVLTTLAALQARTTAHLPEWMQPLYSHGLVATLDDNDDVATVATGEILTDELLEKLAGLPKLKELNLEYTQKITAGGLARLRNLHSLEKLSFHSGDKAGEGVGDDLIRALAGSALRELTIGQCGTTDAGAKLLAQLPQLTSLSLYQEGLLTDEALHSIGALKQLRSLDLSSYVATQQFGWMRFSAVGIRELSGLKELRSLRLVGQEVPAEALAFPKLTSLGLGDRAVDDAVAEQIGKLRELTQLELTYCSVTDEGLREIAKLPRLRRLDISSARISDAGIEHFRTHPRLEHLSLRASGLTDETLEHLAQIGTLTRLDLSGSGRPGVVPGAQFSIAGLCELAALPRLESLWLTNFNIPGGGYDALRELKHLRELNFMMCNVSEDELDALEAALPEAAISSATGSGGRVPKKLREALNRPRQSPPGANADRPQKD